MSLTKVTYSMIKGAPANILDYGADPTGVANSTTAIQAAFDSGAHNIVFPEGSYLINSTITCNTDNLNVDLGNATILNTVAIPITVIYGEDCNSVFYFTGTNVSVSGGYFLDGLSQGIRIDGVYASGDTYTGAGYTQDHFVQNCVFDNWEGNSVQIRFFNSAIIDSVIVKNKGSGGVNHAAELALKYGTGGSITNCQVLNSQNGGAAYGLYVDGFVVSDNIIRNLTNPSSLQSTVGIYADYCLKCNVSNNQALLTTGGVGTKFSYNCNNIIFDANNIQVAGSGGNPYAAVFMQGASNFVISNNFLLNWDNHVIRVSNHTSPANLNSRNGLIVGNKVATNYNSPITPKIGDGIYVSQSTSVDRGGISIIGNEIAGGNIFVQQMGGVDVINSCVKSNNLITAYGYPTTAAGIYVDRCYGMEVSGNFIFNQDTVAHTKIGVLTNIPAYTTIRDNTVLYVGSSMASSYGYSNTGAITTSYWENNKAYRAAQLYDGITSGIEILKSVAAGDNADTNFTLYPGISYEYQRVYGNNYTANRTCTLSTTGAWSGARFKIVRTSGGAFTLDVGGLTTLATNEWCEVVYTGSAWQLFGYGTL